MTVPLSVVNSTCDIMQIRTFVTFRVRQTSISLCDNRKQFKDIEYTNNDHIQNVRVAYPCNSSLSGLNIGRGLAYPCYSSFSGLNIDRGFGISLLLIIFRVEH